MENKANLAKAIIAVMKDVAGIEKSLTVGTGNSSYKGVSDKDVKNIIGKAMAKHGLCVMPINVEAKSQIDRWEETSQWNGQAQVKTKQSVFIEVTTQYLLLHESGESQVIAGYGNGVDTQDKAAGKATTYSLKNALLYTFMVPTGEIDDADKTHSDDMPVPQRKAQPKQVPEPPIADRVANMQNQGRVNPELSKVISDAIIACKSRAEVTAIYNANKELHNNEKFMNLIQAKSAEYPKPETSKA